MFGSFTGFNKDNGKAGGNAFAFLASNATTNGDSLKKVEKENFSGKLASTEPETIMDDKGQLDYYANLKGLNQSLADWIKQKVEQNPFCILTPIFDDYARVTLIGFSLQFKLSFS